MFNRNVLAGLVVALAFGSAHAAEGTSEFFYQTGAGKSDVTAHVGYFARNITGKGSSTDFKLSGLAPLAVAYEYGLSEMLSVEAMLGYASLEDNATPSNKYSGLIDPTVTLKGTQKMDFGHLRFGATLGLGGVTKAKSDTMISGGFSLMPYVGADFAAGPGLLGVRVSYDYRLERTSETSGGADAKTKGGHKTGLSAFYEYMLSDMLFGAAVNYEMTSDAKDENDAVTTKAANTTGASLYARIPAVQGLAIIPRLDYIFSNSNTDAYDKYNEMSLSVAARFEF